jgi:hypothetical protein
MAINNFLMKSIDIYSPDSHETEEVIVYILFEGNPISIRIPEISAASLHSLSFLITQNNLHNVLVSILPALF